MPRSAEAQKAYRERLKAEGRKPRSGPSGRHLPGPRDHGKRGKRGKCKPKFWAKFIGWDGEGDNQPDGSHLYTLLANSAGGHIRSKRGLSTMRCLNFIFDEARRLGRSNHVAFGFSYDVNMILGDLTEEELRQVNDLPEASFERDGRIYWVQYRPRKFFRISRSRGLARWKQQPISGKWKRDLDGDPITIWDVIGFFQCSFVRALYEYFKKDPNTVPLLPEVARLKNLRSQFAEQDPDEVLRYCQTETEYLVLLMDRLRFFLDRCEIQVHAWDGTGAVARYVMREARVTDYMKPTPDELQAIVRTAYSGGRIEAMVLGRTTEKTWDYDITSAYPSVQAGLPCLAHATWKHRKGPKQIAKLGPYYMARVKFRFPEGLSWYPLFVRNIRGTIIYPQWGHGWYWNYEIEAAREFFAQRGQTTRPFEHPEFHVIEAWELVLGCNHRPFGFLEEQYARRAAMKAAGDGAQVALKLSLNSVYGKTLQQVGGTPEKPPPYFQLEWGGMTTSATRAKLVRAGLKVPDRSVLFFATDGILTMQPIPDYDEGTSTLGGWSLVGIYDETVLLLPGVYWLRKGDAWETATRGFEAKKVETEGSGPMQVIEAWRKGEQSLPVSVTRFVTMKTALLSKPLNPTWRRWITSDRSMALNGESAKREPYKGTLSFLADGLILLSPVVNRYCDLSYPYEVDFWNKATETSIAAKLENEELEEQDFA